MNIQVFIVSKNIRETNSIPLNRKGLAHYITNCLSYENTTGKKVGIVYFIFIQLCHFGEREIGGIYIFARVVRNSTISIRHSP